MNSKPNMLFLNCSFDKKRLKALLLWFRLNLSENAALKAVEILQGLGFRSATQGAISLGLDDLKTPTSKSGRVFQAQVEVALAHHEHHRGNRTPVELFQHLVDTWHRTSQDLTTEVVQLFHSTERVNPVYMMAFSGARGNISQVRQLVGMRGLMADPRGQIVGFPILSNFREGLTITEYFVSCYGARKGVVDTAIRTADAGYLTRRLADVSHHVVVRTTNCGTHGSILLRDIKEGQKTILSLANRLVGRVLAEHIFLPTSLASECEAIPSNFNSQKLGVANLVTKQLKTPQLKLNKPKTIENKTLIYRNSEITSSLASKLAAHCLEVPVRSPLSCSLPWGVCQLCYGWGLSEGRRVTLGEAVGIIAAQSIGEPGTQLTLRTFHTGGVFSGELLNEIRAPYSGNVIFPTPLQGLLLRTPHGQIAFLTKVSGKMKISETEMYENLDTKNLKDSEFLIQPSTVIFVKQKEHVITNQLLAEFSSSTLQSVNDQIEITQQVLSETAGQIWFKEIEYGNRKGPGSGSLGTFFSSQKLGGIWVLSGKPMIGTCFAIPSFAKSLPSFFDKTSSRSRFSRQSASECFECSAKMNLHSKHSTHSALICKVQALTSEAQALTSEAQLLCSGVRALNAKQSIQSTCFAKSIQSTQSAHTREAKKGYASLSYASPKGYGKQAPSLRAKQSTYNNNSLKSFIPLLNLIRGKQKLQKLFSVNIFLHGNKISFANTCDTHLVFNNFVLNNLSKFPKVNGSLLKRKNLFNYQTYGIQNRLTQYINTRYAKTSTTSIINCQSNYGVLKYHYVLGYSQATSSKKHTLSVDFSCEAISQHNTKSLFIKSRKSNKSSVASLAELLCFAYLLCTTKEGYASLSYASPKGYGKQPPAGQDATLRLVSRAEELNSKTKIVNHLVVKNNLYLTKKRVRIPSTTALCQVTQFSLVKRRLAGTPIYTFQSSFPDAFYFDNFDGCACRSAFALLRTQSKYPKQRSSASSAGQDATLRLVEKQKETKSFDKYTRLSNVNKPPSENTVKKSFQELCSSESKFTLVQGKTCGSSKKVETLPLLSEIDLITFVTNYDHKGNYTQPKPHGVQFHSASFTFRAPSQKLENVISLPPIPVLPPLTPYFNKTSFAFSAALSPGVKALLLAKGYASLTSLSVASCPAEEENKLSLQGKSLLGMLWMRSKASKARTIHPVDCFVSQGNKSSYFITEKRRLQSAWIQKKRAYLTYLNEVCYVPFTQQFTKSNTAEAFTNFISYTNLQLSRFCVPQKAFSVHSAFQALAKRGFARSCKKKKISAQQVQSKVGVPSFTRLLRKPFSYTSLIAIPLRACVAEQSVPKAEGKINLFPGQLVAYGDNIANNIVTTESGQVLYIDSQKTTVRKAQTVLIYSQAIIAVLSGDWIKKGTPLMSLSYQKLVTGDIVQGLPKIEQFFEAPVLRDGTFWSDSLQAKLNQFFQEAREKLPLAEAVRKGFSEIQRVLVEGVLRVYISQGVLIADKHLEVIVRQMTCKGRILYSGDTGFLRNELVSLDKIENVNQVTYGQKALYHPQVRGITDASLESESFLSAASFQETTRVLSRDAIIGKTDLMRGLKERVIVGELIQAGTALANNSVYNLLAHSVA